MCLFVCPARKVVQAVVAPVAVAVIVAYVALHIVGKHLNFAAALSAFQLAVSNYVINLHLTKFA